MTSTTLPTSTEITVSDAIESFTGFEELEITERFKSDVSTLLEEKPTIGMRAIAFVLVAREARAAGDPESTANTKAYKHVMGLSLKAIEAFFPDDTDESGDDLFEDEPVTPAGKPDEPVS